MSLESKEKNVLAKIEKIELEIVCIAAFVFFSLFKLGIAQADISSTRATLKAEPSSLSVWCQSHLLSVAHSFLFSRSLTEPHYFFFSRLSVFLVDNFL